MKTFAIMNLGCKVNDYESTYVKEQLAKYYELKDFKEVCDIYIIFSCCVTNTAEAKTRKFIHQTRRRNKDAYVVVVGCLSQIKPDLEEFKDVDLIIGSTKKDKVVEYILDGLKENKVENLNEAKFEFLSLDKYPGKDRAFLKIEDGCNQFCSYCVIPYSRGRERSADHLKILESALTLSKNYREIVLTGIHTGRYNDNGYNLYNLLCDLVKIDNLQTIRLSSIEINEISDEIIDLIATNPKIAKHLHVPVQALTNKVLKAMNRPYTIEEYKERIKYIRSKVEHISISTDLIVGFVGEDDETFKQSFKELDEIQFSFIHIFPYSRKSGTKADKMEGHIDERIKKERVKLIADYQQQFTLNYHRSFINRNVEILVEKTDDNYSYGYTKEYIYVQVEGKYQIGGIIKVNIKSVSNEKVVGIYVTE